MLTYTFRYMNADGTIQAMIFTQLDSRRSAKSFAQTHMPTTAASVEIWLEDERLSKECNSLLDTPDNASSLATPARL